MKAIPVHSRLLVNRASRLITIKCAINLIISMTMMIVMKCIIIAISTIIIITTIIIDLIVVIIMSGNADLGCSKLHKGLKAIKCARPC